MIVRGPRRLRGTYLNAEKVPVDIDIYLEVTNLEYEVFEYFSDYYGLCKTPALSLEDFARHREKTKESIHACRRSLYKKIDKIVLYTNCGADRILSEIYMLTNQYMSMLHPEIKKQEKIKSNRDISINYRVFKLNAGNSYNFVYSSSSLSDVRAWLLKDVEQHEDIHWKIPPATICDRIEYCGGSGVTDPMIYSMDALFMGNAREIFL